MIVKSRMIAVMEGIELGCDSKEIVCGLWIDSHAHVFDYNCTYLDGVRYRPSRMAPPGDYLALLDACGIGGAVLVQPSFLGTDNSCLCGTIAARPDELRGVAVVAADVTAEHLAHLHRQGVRGVRLNLIGQPDPDFAEPAWRRWLDVVRNAGMALDLHAAGDRWARLLPPLLDQGMTVVIEHLGRPDGDDPLACAGFRAVLAAAASGRAWVKLSAPYRMAAGVAERAVVPLLESYGPGRLLWGSDFPWTQHEEGKTMPGAMDWLRGQGLSPVDLAAVCGGNARVLYDLPVG